VKTKITLLLITLFLTSCYKKEIDKDIPQKVNEFTYMFLTKVQKGETDSCLQLLTPYLNNEKGRALIESAYIYSKDYVFDSLITSQLRKKKIYLTKDIEVYNVEYEYIHNGAYYFFVYEVVDNNNIMKINFFAGRNSNVSMLELNYFDLSGKSLIHYLFLFISLVVVVFIIFTIISIIRSDIKKKWLWGIFSSIGLVSFGINWTTGETFINLLSFHILGISFIKSGMFAPWIITFSIPLIAITYWVVYFKKQKELRIEYLKGSENNSNEGL